MYTDRSAFSFLLKLSIALIVVFIGSGIETLQAQANIEVKSIPFITQTPLIDGDLSEWKNDAHTDGVWTEERVKRSAWFNPKRNKLVVDASEDTNSTDLQAEYYMGWDSIHLYFGAEIIDNHLDVRESNHEPKRWYYKDAVAWFLEIPLDTVNERFGAGDHAFAFILDKEYPDYGAWWRHGSESETYIEEPLPEKSTKYKMQTDHMPNNSWKITLEASVVIGELEPMFQRINNETLLRMMIVHCDPDGGEYGGHLLMYGQGDDDESWQPIKLIR